MPSLVAVTPSSARSLDIVGGLKPSGISKGFFPSCSYNRPYFHSLTTHHKNAESLYSLCVLIIHKRSITI